MRQRGESGPPHSPSSPPSAQRSRTDWLTLQRLLPYLWQYKWRVVAAIAFMVAAKLANVGVPLLLKTLVDAMSFKPGDPAAMLVVPVGLLVAYGALRLSTSVFTEACASWFCQGHARAARSIALQTFEHLHALSLRFHLERQTGGMTRDIERGVRGIESLISFSLFKCFATLIEVVLVLSVLAVKFDAWFAWITLTALVLYIVYTVLVTEWRTVPPRSQRVRLGRAHQGGGFAAELRDGEVLQQRRLRARRYDESLERLRRARLKSQTTLSMLNAGQQLIIAVGLVAMLWRATQGVVDGRMTLGDLVMVNAFMIQLYIPLNFSGRDLTARSSRASRTWTRCSC